MMKIGKESVRGYRAKCCRCVELECAEVGSKIVCGVMMCDGEPVIELWRCDVCGVDGKVGWFFEEEWKN